MKAIFLSNSTFTDLSEGQTTQRLRIDSEPLVVWLDRINDQITIPVGHVFEESVPRIASILAPQFGASKRAAAVHDYIYTHNGYFSQAFSKFIHLPRSTCDAIYRDCLEAKGVSLPQRWLRWAGVRIGGWASW